MAIQKFDYLIIIITIFLFTGCQSTLLLTESRSKSKIDLIPAKNHAFDVTQLIQSAILNYDTVYLKKGSYYISQIEIPSNRVILTDQFMTKVFQIPGNRGKSIIHVNGSNIIIDSIYIEGNIAIDQGEFNHAISVQATRSMIKDIKIKGLYAKNIRGDGLYIGSRNPKYWVENVEASNIQTVNCFRQGVSITSGRNLFIRNLKTEQSGFYGVDLEPNRSELPFEKISFYNSEIDDLSIVGDKKTSIDHVKFQNLTIDPSVSGSIPPYNKTKHKQDGIAIRSAKNLRFQNTTIRNSQHMAVHIFKEGTNQYSDHILFDSLAIENCSIQNKNYNAYFFLPGVKNIEIKNLAVALPNHIILFRSPKEPSASLVLQNIYMKGGIFAHHGKINATDLSINTSGKAFISLAENSIIKRSTIHAGIVGESLRKTVFDDCQISYDNKDFINPIGLKLIKTKSQKAIH